MTRRQQLVEAQHEYALEIFRANNEVEYLLDRITAINYRLADLQEKHDGVIAALQEHPEPS